MKSSFNNLRKVSLHSFCCSFKDLFLDFSSSQNSFYIRSCFFFFTYVQGIKLIISGSEKQQIIFFHCEKEVHIASLKRALITEIICLKIILKCKLNVMFPDP